MIRLAGIADDSIVDGPGIRVTIFGQGCPHHCPGCQNPETWPFEGGVETEEEALAERVRQNPLARGVTFSGGEPFAQAAGFAKLAALLREDYALAAYTGYTFEQLFAMEDPDVQKLLGLLDILVDGRFVEAERSLSLRFRGSRNQRIIDLPQSLAAGRAVECTAERWTGETT